MQNAIEYDPVTYCPYTFSTHHPPHSTSTHANMQSSALDDLTTYTVCRRDRKDRIKEV